MKQTLEQIKRMVIDLKHYFEKLLTMLGKGDTLDLILTISIISLAILMAQGIEMLFDWYIMY